MVLQAEENKQSKAIKIFIAEYFIRKN